MAKKFIIVDISNLHSVIDLITNSSTEIFVVDNTNIEGIMKEVFDFIKSEIGKGYSESTISSLKDYEYKCDWIIPAKLDQTKAFICEIDQNEHLLVSLLQKYFTVIELPYKD